MPKHVIRRDLSALGFYLVLLILLVNLAAGIIGVVVINAVIIPYRTTGASGVSPQALQNALSSDTLFLLILNAASQYLIGMPVIAYIIKRRLPTIAVRRYLPAYYELEQAAPAAPASVPSGVEGRFAARGAGEVPFRFRDIFALLPIILFLMEAGNMIGSGLALLLGDAAGIEAANSQVELLLSGNLWATILFVVVLAPLAEELFFRKLLIDQISPLGRRGAVLVSAISFALFHQNLFQFFYAAFLGALFAIIYLKTEKIIHTILLHAGVNFFGGVLLPYFTEGLTDIDPSMRAPENAEALLQFAGEHAGGLVFLAIYLLFAIAGMILFFVYRAKGKFRLCERFGTAPYRTFAGAYFTAPGQLLFMLFCAGMAVYTLLGGVV